MLRQLHICDLVIVRNLELEFGHGMTALTGETGAGKSILIDALGLALGIKADNDLIRAGCERAEVTAVFDASATAPALQWLREHELAEDDCILRRVLVRDGRSRAFINGTPVPMQALRELGDLLIDIHGQHAHQSLLRRPSQRRLLDAFGGLQQQVENVGIVYEDHRQLRNRFDELQSAADDRINRIDYLQFQLRELLELGLAENEIDALNDEQHRLAGADRLRTESASLAELLYEADDAVQHVLGRAASTLEELAGLDPQLKDGCDLLRSAQIQVEEAASQLRDYSDRVDLDPERLTDIEARLGKAHDLARKHRLSPDELPGLQADLERELLGLQHAGETLDTLRERLEESWQRYIKTARTLSEARRKTARKLSKTVTAAMQSLAMQGGQFAARVTRLSDDQATPHGLDEVEFEVAANPGQTAAALAKVASGGELSRISLCIQVATAGCGEVPTLIFDEVDVGIGGAVAEMVGRFLRDISASRQVFCITHLAPVAAQGQHHLQVAKLTDGKTTETRVVTLAAEERVHEIARMLGGVDITDQTLAHADEMISKAHSG